MVCGAIIVPIMLFNNVSDDIRPDKNYIRVGFGAITLIAQVVFECSYCNYERAESKTPKK